MKKNSPKAKTKTLFLPLEAVATGFVKGAATTVASGGDSRGTRTDVVWAAWSMPAPARAGTVLSAAATAAPPVPFLAASVSSYAVAALRLVAAAIGLNDSKDDEDVLFEERKSLRPEGEEEEEDVSRAEAPLNRRRTRTAAAMEAVAVAENDDDGDARRLCRRF